MLKYLNSLFLGISPGLVSGNLTYREKSKCGVFSCRGKLAKPQRKRPTLKLILGIKYIKIKYRIKTNKTWT